MLLVLTSAGTPLWHDFALDSKQLLELSSMKVCVLRPKTASHIKHGKKMVLLRACAASCGDHRHRMQWHGPVHSFQSSHSQRHERSCLCCLCLCYCYHCAAPFCFYHQKVGNSILQNDEHLGQQLLLLHVLFFMSLCRSRVVPPLSFSILAKIILLGVIG